jgi:hypothetical protein
MKTLQFTNAELALLFDAVDLMNDKERDMTNDEIALLTVDQSLNHGERMKKIDELVERTRALTALRQRLTFAVQGNDELTSKTVCREDRALYIDGAVTSPRGWGRSLLGRGRSLLGWRNSLIGWRNSLAGWRNSLAGWRNPLIGWRNSLIGWGNMTSRIVAQSDTTTQRFETRF